MTQIVRLPAVNLSLIHIFPFTSLIDAQRQFHDDLREEQDGGSIDSWRQKSQFEMCIRDRLPPSVSCATSRARS